MSSTVTFLRCGRKGERMTSVLAGLLAGVKYGRYRGMFLRDIPRLPGTRDMYKVNDSLTSAL